MKIGVVGLGKMGAQVVTRLRRAGHSVVATDHHQENIDAAIAQGAVGVADSAAVVQQLDTPAVVWLMIAARAVDSEIDHLLTLLPKGSILVDGGNSDYRLTRARAERCRQAGVELVDIGTSGGVLGVEDGFSLMIGGNESAFRAIEPAVQALAQPNGYRYFGPSGAGHFIKMVHNAIEYGVMESYAEGYRLMREGDYPGLDLPAAADVWQHGSIIASTLNHICAEALRTNPQFAGVEGVVAESGEARWALEAAAARQIPMPAIQAAMDARLASQKGATSFTTKLLAAMRNIFGGHALNQNQPKQ
jgi:6-phosphogluconate dehydrogenase